MEGRDEGLDLAVQQGSPSAAPRAQLQLAEGLKPSEAKARSCATRSSLP